MSPRTERPAADARTAEAVVDAYLEQLASVGLATTDLLADDVAFLATVPHWRFRVDGADAARAELGRWFAHPTRVEPLQRIPTGGGEVLVMGLRWEEGGQTWGGHQIHVVTVEDGRIRRLDVACGGRWDAALLAQMPAGVDAG
jgi:hypothetical protein